MKWLLRRFRVTLSIDLIRATTNACRPKNKFNNKLDSFWWTCRGKLGHSYIDSACSRTPYISLTSWCFFPCSSFKVLQWSTTDLQGVLFLIPNLLLSLVRKYWNRVEHLCLLHRNVVDQHGLRLLFTTARAHYGPTATPLPTWTFVIHLWSTAIH